MDIILYGNLTTKMCKSGRFTQLLARLADKCVIRPYLHIFLSHDVNYSPRTRNPGLGTALTLNRSTWSEAMAPSGARPGRVPKDMEKTLILDNHVCQGNTVGLVDGGARAGFIGGKPEK